MKKLKTFHQILFSNKPMLLLIQILILLIIFGTVYQIRYGIINAKEEIFDSWFIYLFGIIPFLSVKSILIGMMALIFVKLVELGKQNKNIAPVLTYVGIICFIIYLVQSNSRKEFLFTLTENESKSADYIKNTVKSESVLPLELKLVSTKKITYLSSDIAADYVSTIVVSIGKDTETGVLSINKPFRYKGYAFYQMSYKTTLLGYSSTILAVKNTNGWSPYIGIICLLVAFILYMADTTRTNLKKRIPLGSIAGLMIVSVVSSSSGREVNVSKMGKLLLIDNGYCKTMELYARQRCSFDVIKPGNRVQKPLQIMAKIMLSDRDVEDDRIFTLSQRKIIRTKSTIAFSAKELHGIINDLENELISNPVRRTPEKIKEIERLQSDYQKYFTLRKTFDTAATINSADNFSSNLQALYLIPLSNKKWKTVTELIKSSDPEEIENYRILKELQKSYQMNDQKSFNLAVDRIISIQRSVVPSLTHKGNIENIYLTVKPFVWAGVFYLSVLVIALFPPGKQNSMLMKSISLLAFMLHSSGIILRWIISGHPPLTNLFDTFIFVSWIGYLVFLLGRHSIGDTHFKSTLASGTALFFLILSRLTGNETDSFNVLPAVLNNNAWLIFHISVIVAGYGAIAVAAILGHLHLIQGLFGSKQQFKLPLIPIFKIGFGLTIAGVLIGGIWADQCWGRFWGWDPKENGALVLILWGCSILIGYKENLIHTTGFAMGAVLSLCIMMVTWIGVNLSGIGLHSYGDNLNSAVVLLLFIGSEVIFLLGICYSFLRKEQVKEVRIRHEGRE